MIRLLATAKAGVIFAKFASKKNLISLCTTMLKIIMLILLSVNTIMKGKNKMDFRVMCTNCWKPTKYDALEVVTGLPCNECGKKL